MAEKLLKERSDANPDREVDGHHVLQEIDKDLGDINWIVQCERVKKQVSESIEKQSLLAAQIRECAEKFRTVSKATRFLLNENKRLRRSIGIIYDLETTDFLAHLERVMAEETYEENDEDEF